jgi:cathepsin F
MKVAAVLLLCFVAAVLAKPAPTVTEAEFDSWKQLNGKTYDGAEHRYRFQVFKQNVLAVHRMNEQSTGAHYAVNKFADMNAEEFKAYYTGLKAPAEAYTVEKAELSVTAAPPTSFDWRTKGAVTPVKDQQQCGSCWSFSTTGAIEGAWFIAKNQLVSLSEQELVDCDSTCSGCGGGLMTLAFNWTIQNGGLEGEADYPYVAQDTPCTEDKKKNKASISAFKVLSDSFAQPPVPPMAETDMAAALVSLGPLAIALNANKMQFYSHGIDNEKNCDPTALDHGVLAVGYGVENNVPYWIIKNSWGAGWGEQGYYRIKRGVGACGLNTCVSHPTV